MLSLLALAVWSVESLLNLPLVSDPQIRPDGQVCAYVVQKAGGPRDLYLQGLNDKEGRKSGSFSRPRWSPDGKKLAVMGKGQVLLLDPANGHTTPVTHSLSPVQLFQWLPAGDAIAYLADDPGPAPDPIVADHDYRYARVYLQPLSGGEPRLLTKADHHVQSFAFSPDGQRLVYAGAPTPRNRDAFRFDIYSVDVKTLEEKPLVSQPGRDADVSYSPDGKWIAFHSQTGSENYFSAREVGIIPASGGQIRYITRGLAQDVFRGGNVFTWEQDALFFTAGEGTTDVLIRYDLNAGRAETLTSAISGAASFSADAKRAVYLKTSTNRPPEVFVRENGAEHALTHIHDGLSAYPEIRSRVVRWKSTDGTPVEGVLWLPVDYQQGKRYPLLTELHGGPTGATLNAFPLGRTYPIPIFAQRGFAVFSPNFRGSVNYGAPFRLKNTLSQGVGDYQDVITGIDKLIAEGVADPERLGVMGWSYGGFLSGSVISQTTRFRAASIGAPATDWATYYGQSDGAPEVLVTYFGGLPYDAAAAYEKHSYRSRLDKIRTPALLQVGAVDINHNSEIYKALVDHNVPVEYVVYPREGHGITELPHVRDLMERNLAWFTRWLKPSNAN